MSPKEQVERMDEFVQHLRLQYPNLEPFLQNIFYAARTEAHPTTAFLLYPYDANITVDGIVREIERFFRQEPPLDVPPYGDICGRMWVAALCGNGWTESDAREIESRCRAPFKGDEFKVTLYESQISHEAVPV
jgi:hypothetical protein